MTIQARAIAGPDGLMSNAFLGRHVVIVDPQLVAALALSLTLEDEGAIVTSVRDASALVGMNLSAPDIVIACPTQSLATITVALGGLDDCVVVRRPSIAYVIRNDTPRALLATVRANGACDYAA